MQARCPHCTAVFNTERYGVQFCPSCGQQVDVPGAAASSADASGSSPAAPGVPGIPPGSFGPVPPSGGALPPGGGGLPPDSSSPGERNGPPWEHREAGAPAAFIETLKQTLIDPLGFFSRMRTQGKLMDAILYAWLFAVVNAILQLPFMLLGLGMNRFNPIMEALQKSSGGGASPQQLEMFSKLLGGGATIGIVVATLIFTPVVLIITAGIFHLCALICGAAKNGFETTLRVVCYSQGPSLFSVIPCLGFIGGIWVLVLYGVGLYKAQETTPTRAVLALVLPILVCCCCGGAVFFLFAARMASSGSLSH